MRQLIRYFDISRIYTRVGIITYSTTPIPVSNFASFSRRYDLLRAVRKIRFPRGRSYTGRALRFVRRYLYGGRPSSSRARVLVVVTGSRSSDRVRRPAEMLKLAGVEIFAVGMGGRSSRASLSAIANDRYHVFTGLRLVLKLEMTSLTNSHGRVMVSHLAQLFMGGSQFLQPCMRSRRSSSQLASRVVAFATPRS